MADPTVRLVDVARDVKRLADLHNLSVELITQEIRDIFNSPAPMTKEEKDKEAATTYDDIVRHVFRICELTGRSSAEVTRLVLNKVDKKTMEEPFTTQGFAGIDTVTSKAGVHAPHITGKSPHTHYDGTQDMQGSEGKDSYRVPIPVRYDLIPPMALRQLAEVFEEGAKKYGPNAYIEKPIPFSNIVNHLLNHLNRYQSGDHGENHLAKIAWAACAMMVLEWVHPEMNDLSEVGVRTKDV